MMAKIFLSMVLDTVTSQLYIKLATLQINLSTYICTLACVYNFC